MGRFGRDWGTLGPLRASMEDAAAGLGGIRGGRALSEAGVGWTGRDWAHGCFMPRGILWIPAFAGMTITSPE